MVRKTARTVGDQAEQYARQFLEDQGLRTLSGNFHCRFGEIDLIMQDGRTIVFVEVRFRSGKRFTSARFTVDARKRSKLIKTAAMFLARNNRYANALMRFDVVGVDRDSDGTQRLHWLRDAFRPADSSL